MAIDYDLEKYQFLDAISRRFRKDFDDICTVDTSTKDTFKFTLKSGDTVSVKCKFDDLFSDYFSGSSGAEVYNKLLACIGINKYCYRIADAFIPINDKDNILKNVKLFPVNIHETSKDEENIISGSVIYQKHDIYALAKEDIAFIPKMCIESSDSKIPVIKNTCEALGISKEELLDAAIKNTINSEYNIIGLTDMLVNKGIPCPDVPLYIVISDSIKTPALFVSDEIIHNIAKTMDDDYWILPSSTEEFLIIPKSMINVSEKEDIMNLINLIKVANEKNDIKKDDIFLSDSLYQYTKENGFEMVHADDFTKKMHKAKNTIGREI